MTRVNDKFAQAFGIPHIDSFKNEADNESTLPIVADAPTNPKLSDELANSDADFEFVRKTLYSLIKNGTDAFEQLSEIARVEEKISAYGTMNEMLSNLSDISMKLMDVHEKKKKMDSSLEKSNPHAAQHVTNNIVYAGSLTDLDRMLDKGDIIDV